MTKRFCDRCGKEVGVFKDIEFQTWWTITRHGMMDLTTELCDDCYQAKFLADTPQTESTGSPIGDYRDGVGAWQTDRMTEEEFDTMIAKGLLGQTERSE